MDMVKNYILDTNVIVHDPECFYNFEDNNVIIPIVTLEELDHIKTREGMVGYHARMAARELNALRGKGSLEAGVKLPGGGMLRVELNHMDMTDFPQGIDLHNNDTRIIAVAKNIQNEDLSTRTILVTKDVYMVLKADSFGVYAEDYINDKVKCDELYKGYREMTLSSEDMNRIYKSGLPVSEDWFDEPLYPNEFVHVRSHDEPSHELLSRRVGDLLVPLRHVKQDAWGLVPMNRNQKMAFELLMDPAVPFVTLTGGAGSGKTIMATAVALEKVIEQGEYRKIVFVRPTVAAGNDIGYLPGTEEEKLRPWMGSFYDAIENLMQSRRAGSREEFVKPGRLRADKPDFSVENFIETYRAKGVIETKTFTYMRGRTLSNALVIVDEAQELTPHLAKLMLTRAGFGSKFVFIGDPTDNQIDNVLVDAKSNGLVYTVEKMKPFPITGHMVLEEVERSPLASLAERNM
jgi:PhoH-like ATPase